MYFTVSFRVLVRTPIPAPRYGVVSVAFDKTNASFIDVVPRHYSISSAAFRPRHRQFAANLLLARFAADFLGEEILPPFLPLQEKQGSFL